MRDKLSEQAIELLQSDRVATLATINPDGSPHVSSAWIGIEGDELVIATLPDQRKLRNVRRDPRVALAVSTGRMNEWGLESTWSSRGLRVTEGWAAARLQRLAYTYLGPDVVFPKMPNPPPGFVTCIRFERVRGIGPWQRAEG